MTPLSLLLIIAVAYGNHGCQGGNMHSTFLFIVANDGLDTEKSYAYSGKVDNDNVLSYIHVKG